MSKATCKNCEIKQCRVHYYCEHCKKQVKVQHVMVCTADERRRDNKLRMVWKKATSLTN